MYMIVTTHLYMEDSPCCLLEDVEHVPVVACSRFVSLRFGYGDAKKCIHTLGGQNDSKPRRIYIVICTSLAAEHVANIF